MHPLESKIQAPKQTASETPKLDPTAPQRIRLQGLLGPLVGIGSGFRAQIEAQLKDLSLSADQRGDINAILESLRALERHAKRLLP